MSFTTPVIGLEIHAKLNTKTKLFSRASQQESSLPNSRVGFYDGAIPGSFPLINYQALEKALLFGLYTQATLASLLTFDKQLFFFTDTPKGYKLTQHKNPLFTFGRFYSSGLGHTVALEKILLEEDSATLIDLQGKTGIDLNTSGDAILEIATTPKFTCIDKALVFLEDVQKTLVTLDISSTPLKVDLNLSFPSKVKGLKSTLLEIKNLPSTAIKKGYHEGLIHLKHLEDNHQPFIALYDYTQERIVKTVPKKIKYLYLQDVNIPLARFDSTFVKKIEEKLENLRKNLY
jgi:aspartyl-tRNA(Asn)/glutamyl-tRNA(Gln) amidotransferase subunit B